MENSLPGYKIRVRGMLDPAWSVWFEGMQIALEGDDEAPETVLTGPVRDQATLRGLLNRLWDLNLDVIEMSRWEISQ